MKGPMFNIFTDYNKSSNPIKSNTTNFIFELSPEDVQLKIYEFFDEMSLVSMKNVNKMQNSYANHLELWEQLGKRIRYYQPIMAWITKMPSIPNCERKYETFLTRVTLIVNRKIPKNCDVKEWLDSIFVESNEKLINKGKDFVNRSNISRHDKFECMPITSFNSIAPTLPYLTIEFKSKETNLLYNLRFKNGRAEPILEKYIFLGNAIGNYSFNGLIEANYGHSHGRHARNINFNNNQDLFNEIEIKILNKIVSITSKGLKIKKQADIAAMVCKAILVGMAYYYAPSLL